MGRTMIDNILGREAGLLGGVSARPPSASIALLGESSAEWTLRAPVPRSAGLVR
jgi:6-phosphofructokinase